jgi:hypothetical protein
MLAKALQSWDNMTSLYPGKLDVVQDNLPAAASFLSLAGRKGADYAGKTLSYDGCGIR